MEIKKADIKDIKAIHVLINSLAKRELMLPRSLNELYENIRDHFVYRESGEIVGVCSLHILWEDLAEIKSLAVKEGVQKRGVGKSLIENCVKEARSLGVKKIFALTYHPDFFVALGFKEINKSKLPQKIWSDCLRCSKFPDCDESAVIIKIKI